MTAFDEFAAALLADANIAIDGVYAPQIGAVVELKVDAGTGVILSKADETADVFETGSRRSATIALIAQAALSSKPQDGDQLAAAGRSFIVRSAERDSADVLWRLDLDEVGT